MTGTGRHFLIASLPAALVGVHRLGASLRAGSAAAIGDSWQFALLARLGLRPEAQGIAASLLTGAVFWLPLLVVALAVALAWSELFARARGRARDPIWLPAGWLFALILPPASGPGLVILALSFGLVFGCHAFGGSGRYLVSPVLLGAVFLALGYPASVEPGAWLPGGGAVTTWSMLAAGGSEPLVAAGTSLRAAFAGAEIGATGATSALACLLGAAYLLAVRVAALPVVLGGLAGLFVCATGFGELPWAWQLAVGNFAFVLAFVATDPTTQPRAAAAAWAYGALFGALTILLRTANPEHPEGSWAALLLASLCIPLLDRLAVVVAKTGGAARHA